MPARRVANIVLLGALALMLAGCDKCGNWPTPGWLKSTQSCGAEEGGFRR